MSEDDKNVVDWIRGKADLKEGLAFPPDFLKRDFTKPTPRLPVAVGVPAGPGKTGKIPKAKPITVPKGVNVKLAGNTITAKGPKGKVAFKDPRVTVVTEPVIRVLNEDFGHKPGSLAATKSSGFKDGMTVAEYKKLDLGIGKGWQSGHLKNMVRRGFLKIEG